MFPCRRETKQGVCLNKISEKIFDSFSAASVFSGSSVVCPAARTFKLIKYVLVVSQF